MQKNTNEKVSKEEFLEEWKKRFPNGMMTVSQAANLCFQMFQSHGLPQDITLDKIEELGVRIVSDNYLQEVESALREKHPQYFENKE